MSHANFVQCKLAGPITASATELTVESGGAAFNLPPADGGVLTLTDSLGRPEAYELIAYTARTGSGPVFTLTGVTRGGEGTVARAWSTGQYVLQGLTVGELQKLLGAKVDKATGQSLMLDAERTKLAGIAAGAQVNTVTSVAGRTGAVTLAKADVGLNNVDNTPDTAKPVSTAQQAALDGKVDKVSGKGLSTNDLTAALLTKLNASAPLASPALTGNPTAPTPAAEDSDTSIATTAHVKAAMGLFGLNNPSTEQAWHTGNLVKQTGPTDTTNGSLVTTEGLMARAGTAGALGFRNKLINGGFDIQQRGGNGQTKSGHSYVGPDRWLFRGTTSTGGSVQAVVANTFVQDAWSNTSYLKINRTGLTDYLYFEQRLEGVRPYGGKTFTLSFLAQSDIGEAIRVEVMQGFGTSGSAAVLTSFGSISAPIEFTGQRHSLTFTIPSVTDKTINDADCYTAIRILCLGLSGSVRFSQIQLEEGSVATPFEQRPIGLELSLCQRYYYVATPFPVYLPTSNANTRRGQVNFPTKMRVHPTVTIAVNTGTPNVTTTSQDGTSLFIQIVLSDSTTLVAVNELTADAEL